MKHFLLFFLITSAVAHAASNPGLQARAEQDAFQFVRSRMESSLNVEIVESVVEGNSAKVVLQVGTARHPSLWHDCYVADYDEEGRGQLRQYESHSQLQIGSGKVSCE